MPRPKRIRPLSRAEVREVDRRAIDEFGLPGAVLMENAGRGAAELLLKRKPTGSVVICAGKGNNGGDGFVVARHLENRGVPVRVILFALPSRLQGDAAIFFHVLNRAGTSIEVVGDDPEEPSDEQPEDGGEEEEGEQGGTEDAPDEGGEGTPEGGEMEMRGEEAEEGSTDERGSDQMEMGDEQAMAGDDFAAARPLVFR